MDMMECLADDHMDHSCQHEDDVYVRCKPPTWAGLYELYFDLEVLKSKASIGFII